jgi:hypothetical protein
LLGAVAVAGPPAVANRSTGCAWCAGAVLQLRRLTTLRLGNNELVNNGAKSFARICRLPELRDLSLFHNPLWSRLAAEVGRDVLQAGGKPGIWSSFAFYLRVRERWRDGLRYALSLALTPTEADWAGVPWASGPALYYLLRPVRLTGKYLCRLGEQSRRRSRL